MEIFYNKNTQEILTKDEVDDEVNDRILSNEIYLELLSTRSASELWDMLTPDAQDKIWEEAKEEEIDTNYISREIYL